MMNQLPIKDICPRAEWTFVNNVVVNVQMSLQPWSISEALSTLATVTSMQNTADLSYVLRRRMIRMMQLNITCSQAHLDVKRFDRVASTAELLENGSSYV